MYLSLKFMINEENLVLHIKNSKIFNEQLKLQLITHFEKLNNFQKNKILEALNYEKHLALNYLRGLKNSEIMSFEEIKNNIEALHRNNRKKLEAEEENNKQEELWNLLNSLDFI